MPRKTTQPRTDAEFVDWAKMVTSHCTTNLSAWGISQAFITDLGGKVGSAIDAYTKNSDPSTKNRTTVATKNETFRILRETMSVVVPALVSNTKISNDELAQMGLPTRIHHYHGPLPVPANAPNVEVHSGEHHVVDVYVSNPQLGQVTSYLKDPEDYGFVMRYKLEDEETWHEKNYTKLHTRLIFEDKDVKKNLSIMVAWINPRLEHGPWSDTITVIVN
jgi:hypothetical protein